jgi:hypothetical protein
MKPDSPDIAALRQTAEKAIELTPGTWELGDGWVYTGPIHEDNTRLADILGVRYADPERAASERVRAQANLTHIVAFRPDVAIALLDEVERLQAVVTSIEAEVKAQEDAIERSLALDLWHKGIDYQKSVLTRIRHLLPRGDGADQGEQRFDHQRGEHRDRAQESAR